jgi:Protein of unknown function (DUF2911)
MRIPVIAVAIAVALVGSACAQQKFTSPPAEATTTINGKKITIKYSAPSLHGRKMLGGTNAYGQVWRTGANSATALHTDANLKIGDLSVPAGDYTLYSIPEADSFTLIVNKQTGQWGTEYNEGQDLGRVKMNVKHPSAPVETLKISLSSDGGNKGTLTIAWQDVEASAPITVE